MRYNNGSIIANNIDNLIDNQIAQHINLIFI